MLDKFCHARYNNKAFKNQYGRLAQLVAHPLDVREVTSSSLVSSTILEKSELDSDREWVRISCFYQGH